MTTTKNNEEVLRLVRIESDLHAHVQVFHEHVKQDEESFEKLEETLEKIATAVDVRFDKLEDLITDMRLHTARREGGEDAIKRVAGYISGLVAAIVSGLSVALQKFFLE